jgi:hypothetical protein
VILDDKILQTIVASQPEATDGYCPECGRPHVQLSRPSCRGATSRTAWQWILAALGLYLAVAFGREAWDAEQLAAVRFEELRGSVSWCALPSGIDSRCADLAAARGLDPVLARLARYTTAEREARRDLIVVVVGALATLAGLAGATPSLPDVLHEERPSRWVRVLRSAHDILALGAIPMVPGAQVLLAASCYLALARLLHGVPPSGELVVWSVQRTIELIVAVVQNA